MNDGPLDPDSPPERHIHFDSIFNFRDLGGYEAAGGRSVRWRTLFRADGLNRLSGDDLVRCAELGVRTVLDLRTQIELSERGRIGDRSDDDVVIEMRYHHLPFITQMWERGAAFEATDPARYLADRYLDMLDDGAEAIGEALRIIADPASMPLVFHCAAGKDRTGVLAALTLSLLGVSDDDIATDYGLTRHGLERLGTWLRTERPELLDAMVDQPAPFLAAPDEAMHLFLHDLRQRHGTVEAYAVSVGVDARSVSALREHLLVQQVAG